MMARKGYLPGFPDRLAVAVLTVASVVAIAGVNFTPRPSANVAVVYPPWISGREAIVKATKADALIVRAGRFPFILIVHPRNAALSIEALRHGALLVLDAEAVAGCLRLTR